MRVYLVGLQELLVRGALLMAKVVPNVEFEIRSGREYEEASLHTQEINVYTKMGSWSMKDGTN